MVWLRVDRVVGAAMKEAVLKQGEGKGSWRLATGDVRRALHLFREGRFFTEATLVAGVSTSEKGGNLRVELGELLEVLPEKHRDFAEAKGAHLGIQGHRPDSGYLQPGNRSRTEAKGAAPARGKECHVYARLSWPS